MELEKAVCVITGSVRGFGKALADALERHGATVIRTSLKPTDGAVTLDVRDDGMVESVATQVARDYGRIDLWVNNAGVWVPDAPIEALESAKVRDAFDVDVIGVMRGTAAAAKRMVPAKRGVILNVITTAALGPRADLSSYTAIKYATDGYTKCARLELAPHGVHVLAVYPGGMRTAFFDEKRPANYDDFMEPAYVAGLVVENLARDAPEQELVVRRPGA